jgi:hypothetical protein
MLQRDGFLGWFSPVIPQTYTDSCFLVNHLLKRIAMLSAPADTSAASWKRQHLAGMQ